MAQKKPLVSDGSGIQQLQSGDIVIPSALGTGTANSTTFLRGDGTWAAPAGGTSIPSTEIAFGTGTGITSSLALTYNSSTLTLLSGVTSNESSVQLGTNGTVSFVSSSKTGSGSYLPLVFNTSDTERMRISEAGLISFSGQVVAKNGTLTDGTTIDWDGNTNGQVVAVTITDNRTMNAPTNIQQYAMYVLRVSQDGTGGRTLGWNGAYKFGSGGPPSLSTGSNVVDIFSFIGGSSNTLECIGYRIGAV